MYLETEREYVPLKWFALLSSFWLYLHIKEGLACRCLWNVFCASEFSETQLRASAIAALRAALCVPSVGCVQSFSKHIIISYYIIIISSSRQCNSDALLGLSTTVKWNQVLCQSVVALRVPNVLQVQPEATILPDQIAMQMGLSENVGLIFPMK